MIRQFVLSILGVGTLLMSVSAAFAQQVVVTPEETDEILANPGMGWETFHHTSKQDKSLPAVDSLHGPLRPLGMGRIGAAAWEAQHGISRQGAEGNPRLGPEVGVPGHVLLDLPRASVPSKLAQGYRRQGTS